ncbi:unnamed protein product [Closterium sp. Naga37s-1]|nr:unnamed protein product [Closterium sp. Naga37s-1]
MFRNQYDTDVTTWSPVGRLHQVIRPSLRLSPRRSASLLLSPSSTLLPPHCSLPTAPSLLLPSPSLPFFFLPSPPSSRPLPPSPTSPSLPFFNPPPAGCPFPSRRAPAATTAHAALPLLFPHRTCCPPAVVSPPHVLPSRCCFPTARAALPLLFPCLASPALPHRFLPFASPPVTPAPARAALPPVPPHGLAPAHVRGDTPCTPCTGLQAALPPSAPSVPPTPFQLPCEGRVRRAVCAGQCAQGSVRSANHAVLATLSHSTPSLAVPPCSLPCHALLSPTLPAHGTRWRWHQVEMAPGGACDGGSGAGQCGTGKTRVPRCYPSSCPLPPSVCPPPPHQVEYAMGAVEYAMEAVKQGSAAVGLRSTTHAVLATLKRAASPLASYQRKIFRVDDHMGIAIAGLNADGRVLCRFMRSECLSHKFVFESPLPVGRLVSMVADKSQVCTQRSWRRPYGVGLLVAGFDQTGPHIFQTCPSGNFWEFHAMAIGARSQAAKTYLERKYESFGACSLDELVRHALLAVKESLQEGELSGANCSVSIVGEGQAFGILTDAQVQEHIDRMENEEGGQGGAAKEEVEVVEEVEVEDVEEEKAAEGEGEEGGTGEGSEGPAPMEA